MNEKVLISDEKLQEFAPFNILSTHYLDEALEALHVYSVGKGTLIFKRGKTLPQRFFLLKGRVDLIDNSFEVSHMEAGEERASVALNQESPTSASAIAKTDCIYFTIDAEYLDRLLGWSQSAEQPRADESESLSEFGVEEVAEGDDWMSKLLQSPLFTRVPLPQLQELFSRFENYFPKKGEAVVREGERGEYFYVLAAGSARITNKTNSVDVAVGPGDYFGEEALIGNTLRNATVTMTSDGLLKRLSAENFNELLIAPVLRFVPPEGLKNLAKPYKLIDVKMPVEYRVSHEPGSINVPLSRLRKSLHEFGSANIYVVPEDAGSRAHIAAHLLCQAGLDAMILRKPNREEQERETA